MGKYDKSWAELNAPRIGKKSNPRLTPQTIGVIKPANPIKRAFKAFRLWAMTNYCWSVAWQKAA